MLSLGTIDERVRLTDAGRREFLDLYHHPAGFVDGQLRFRDDSRNRWRPWRPTPGAAVTRLTQRL